MFFDGKNSLIGNTPMIKINYEYRGNKKSIYTKLEYYNITGSIKDRVVYYMIKNAEKRGELKKGMPIIEATSGNTGISLSALGTYYNYPVYIFMPDWASEERVKLMKSYNANVILISRENGGFIKCLEEAEKLAKEKNGFWANQFENQDNFEAHYETTGKEILRQIPEKIGGFVSGVGTGGTLMGISTRLKEKFLHMKTVAIEPEKMPIISQEKILEQQKLGENQSEKKELEESRIGQQKFEQHKIEGIGDDFIPGLLEKDKIDDIILINDEDAINMSRKFAKHLGLGVGISSGANFIGSVLLNQNVNDAVVTVFSDDNKKYLSTDLSKDVVENEKFISNQIKILDYEVM